MVPYLLLALTLLMQGAPAIQSDNGSISGVLKSSDGNPVPGVRVAAMLVPDSAADVATVASMASLVASDDMGRYRLENIPPGRYFIVAGRVDLPTYYPGAQDMSDGTVISVTAKANLTGLDFELKDSSFRLAGLNIFDGLSFQPAISAPVRVIVEGQAKQPVFSNGNFVTISLTRVSDGMRDSAILGSMIMSVPIRSAAIGAEYRVTIENLPDGYVIQSLKYGTVDLLNSTLKLDIANFQQLTNQNTGVVVLNIFNPGVTISASSSGVSGVANSSIVVTLAPVARSTPASGVRVTGKAPVTGPWAIFRGTKPGIFFTDGTFELTDVPAGRHIVLLQENTAAPRYYAALINVRDRDVDGVILYESPFLPKDFNVSPTSASGPSDIKPLAGLRGLVFEEENGMPLARGLVTVLGQPMKGQSSSTISIGGDGRFAIPHLLPGSYDLRIEAFEHFTLYQTVVITDEDAQVEFKVRSSLTAPGGQ